MRLPCPGTAKLGDLLNLPCSPDLWHTRPETQQVARLQRPRVPGPPPLGDMRLDKCRKDIKQDVMVPCALAAHTAHHSCNGSPTHAAPPAPLTDHTLHHPGNIPMPTETKNHWSAPHSHAPGRSTHPARQLQPAPLTEPITRSRAGGTSHQSPGQSALAGSWHSAPPPGVHSDAVVGGTPLVRRSRHQLLAQP